MNTFTIILAVALLVYILSQTGYSFWLLTKALDNSQLGIMSKNIIRIAKFQDRFNPPENAEELSKSDNCTHVEKKGKYGGIIRNYDHVIYTCPKCKRKHELLFKHGDTVRCICGLYSQTHGSGLTVWK